MRAYRMLPRLLWCTRASRIRCLFPFSPALAFSDTPTRPQKVIGAPELLFALRPPIPFPPFQVTSCVCLFPPFFLSSSILYVAPAWTSAFTVTSCVCRFLFMFFFVRHTLCGACLDERFHNLLVPVTFCKPQRAAAVGIE